MHALFQREQEAVAARRAEADTLRASEQRLQLLVEQLQQEKEDVEGELEVMRQLVQERWRQDPQTGNKRRRGE